MSIPGVMLVMGGEDTGHPLVLCECYDSEQKSWLPAAPMRERRCEAAAVLLPNDKVMICGGRDNWLRSASIELLDVDSDTWQEGESTPQPRSGHSTIPKCFAMVIGYCSSAASSGCLSRSVLCYDLQSSTWTFPPDTCISCLCFSLLSLFVIAPVCICISASSTHFSCFSLYN